MIGTTCITSTCCPHNWRKNDEFQLEVDEITDVIFFHPCSQNSVLGQLEFKNCYRVRPHTYFQAHHEILFR